MGIVNYIRSSYGALQLLYHLSGGINLFCRKFDRSANCLARETAALPAGLLNGQNLPPLADLPYGAWRIGANGCEVIAAYNVLQALGRPERFHALAAELERCGLLFNGFGGTNLGALVKLFRLRGVGVKVLRSGDSSRYGAELTEAKCAVLSYWTGRTLRRADKSWNTLHTVSVHHDNGVIMICNASPNRREPAFAKSLYEFLTREGALPVCLFLLKL